MSALRTRDLIAVSLRLTLLQTTWCEGAMQSIGLAYGIAPGLQRLDPDDTQLAKAFERLKAPFNTHPYMAGILAGALLKMFETGSSTQEMRSFLRGTMGPLAALGDPFFRGALPHFATVCASLAAMWGGAFAGALTLVILFNTVHMIIRIRGVFIGYREGVQVLPRVARWIAPSRTKTLQTFSAAGSGAVIVTLAIKYANAEPWWIAVGAAVGTLIAASALARWRALHAIATPIALAAVFLIEVLT